MLAIHAITFGSSAIGGWRASVRRSSTWCGSRSWRSASHPRTGSMRSKTLSGAVQRCRPRASAEVDLPHHVGLGPDQAGSAALSGQTLCSREVELVGEPVVDEPADHVLDGQRQ